MRIRWDDLELEVVNPRAFEMRNSDLAALQREMGWTLKQVVELQQLEAVGAALMVFATFRRNGRLVSYTRAEQLLDEVEIIKDPADAGEDAGEEDTGEDPTSAPTGSARGDDDGAVSTAPSFQP